MAYISRQLENKFLQMNKFFKVVLLTGARQIGKTSMLKHLSGKAKRTYVTLDDLMARNLAKTDPVLFFQMYKPPIIIDEVQYAPELFSQIKIMCDNSDKKGEFWLTGSQQFSMMKNVKESLAGRIGIIDLFSFSYNELHNIHFKNTLDFSLATLSKRQKLAKKNDIHKIFKYIWTGGMPEVQKANESMRNLFFSSYVDTYLMKDASELGSISSPLKFRKFLVAAAALIGQQVNYKTLAEASDISQPTAKEWLALLESMGILYLLKPYANNHLKRLTKTPKLYFRDSGLAAFLSMWPTKETLMNGPASGYYFENFVVIEILKNYSYNSDLFDLFYYRDSNAKEIDLIIELNGILHPIEIKKSANPDKNEIKKFETLSKTKREISSGGIVCMTENIVPLDSKHACIPCNIV